MGRLENSRQGERMEKLCHQKGREEVKQDRQLRVRGDGNIRSSKRIGERIENKNIPFFPVKITFSFHSFHFEDLPSLPMMQTRKRGLIFASEKGNKTHSQALFDMLIQTNPKRNRIGG